MSEREPARQFKAISDETARPLLAQMHPANFALVMATGIVSIACHRMGLQTVAVVLLWFNIVACPALWLLLALRMLRHAEHVRADLLDPNRSAGFFAMAAGLSVLGIQMLTVAQQPAIAWLLWLAGVAVTLAWSYGLFTLAITAPRSARFGRAIHGGWLVAVVAIQASVSLGAQLAGLDAGQSGLPVFLCLSLWLVGVGLYGCLIVLIIHRWLFHRMTGPDMTPPYWINMGAAAISALAGLDLDALASASAMIADIQPFIHGFTLMFWATASWWIPLLLLLGVWRYLHQRVPLRYNPLYWCAVFPLGMYTVCTNELIVHFDLPFLTPLTLVGLIAACAAWLLAALGLAWQMAFGPPSQA